MGKEWAKKKVYLHLFQYSHRISHNNHLHINFGGKFATLKWNAIRCAPTLFSMIINYKIDGNSV